MKVALWVTIAVLVFLLTANPLYVWLVADSSHHNYHHYAFHGNLEVFLLIGVGVGVWSLRGGTE